MCTCNGSRFLHEQLRSIAAQTVLPLELVICDDASTDDSQSIVEDFGRTAPFSVRLFRNEQRLGPSRNFEQALQLCAGETIFLCDQDDVWKPSKIARMLEALERSPQAVYAFSDAEMVDALGDHLGQNLWQAVGLRQKLTHFRGAGQLGMLLKHNVITGATMALRKSFRDVVLPIPSGWMHDYWIVLLGSSLFYGVPVPECLMQYRRHASQVCGWRKMTFLQVCMKSLNVRAEDWTEKVANFRRLLDRLDSISPQLKSSPERLHLLKQKELHLMTRARTRSSNGLLRISRVMAEACTGRYQRFSESWFSVVRDL